MYFNHNILWINENCLDFFSVQYKIMTLIKFTMYYLNSSFVSKVYQHDLTRQRCITSHISTWTWPTWHPRENTRYLQNFLLKTYLINAYTHCEDVLTIFTSDKSATAAFPNIAAPNLLYFETNQFLWDGASCGSEATMIINNVHSSSEANPLQQNILED